MRETEIAVIGAGIAGLAFALAHAKRGRKVVVFERADFAAGASIRNFGLVWPIGQRLGAAHDRAMRSREIWLEVIAIAGLWARQCGSVHLAFEEDEMAVLSEYASSDESIRCGRKLIGGREAAELSAAQVNGLRGALWSPTEINVDPRQAMRQLPEMLRRRFGVEFQFETNVLAADGSRIATSAGDWKAEQTVICSGAEFRTLFPAEFAAAGLTRCKLQMMRTRPQPKGWSLGAAPCGGLTLAHYDCFADCPSHRELRRRIQAQMPFFAEHGIHVLLSETGRREITIGDSHEYGQTFEPVNREDINRAILDYLKKIAAVPSLEIAERWNGVYAKMPGQAQFVRQVSPNVLIVTGLSAGMTLAFGLAEDLVSGAHSV